MGVSRLKLLEAEGFILRACFLLLFVTNVHGADLLCVDSDNDGVIGTLKSVGKADRDCDGELSVADGGLDCDDTDPRIRNGEPTYYNYEVAKAVCSAGQYRNCSGGSLSSCVSTAPTLRTNNFYINTTTGSGTTCSNASPCANFNEFESGGSHTGADLSIWVCAPTATPLNDTFNTVSAGTSAGSPNTVKVDPRCHAKISNSGSSSTFTIDQNNWSIEGLEITGGGKNIVQANNITFKGNWVHDVTGTTAANNATCLDAGANSTVTFTHNIATDCYDPAKTGSGDDRQNVALITAYNGDGTTIQYNHLSYSHIPGISPYEKQGKCIKWKHGCTAANCPTGSTSNNNTLANCDTGIEVGGHAKVVSRGNLGLNLTHAVGIADGAGGDGYYLDGIQFINNTFDVLNLRVTGGALSLSNRPDEASPAGSCSPSTNVTFTGNVVRDSQSSYGGDHVDLWDLFHYGTNGCYTSFVTGGKITITSNCYDPTPGCSSTSAFNVFADASSGSSGSSVNYTNWSAGTYTYDSGGVCGSVSFNSDYQPTSTCTSSSIGWQAEWPAIGTTTTTTTTTTSTLAANSNRSRLQGNNKSRRY